MTYNFYFYSAITGRRVFGEYVVNQLGKVYYIDPLTGTLIYSPNTRYTISKAQPIVDHKEL